MPAKWVFLEGPRNEWTWRTITPDGGIDRVSRAFSTYGTAVLDAIKQGFRPRGEHWMVVSLTGTTHFTPNAPPADGHSTGPSGRRNPPDWKRIREAAAKREPTPPQEDVVDDRKAKGPPTAR